MNIKNCEITIVGNSLDVKKIAINEMKGSISLEPESKEDELLFEALMKDRHLVINDPEGQERKFIIKERREIVEYSLQEIITVKI